MPNYKNGKIYKIVNDENDIVYIGSTAQTLAKRMHGHKTHSIDKKRANGLYPAMRQLGVENFEIVLIKDASCENRSELEEIEYAIIRKYQRKGIELYNMTSGKGKLSWVSRDLISKNNAGKNNPNFGKTGAKSPLFKRGSVRQCSMKGLLYWRFDWREDGRTKAKTFSVNKYGNKRAKRLAEQVRDDIFPIAE